MTPRDHDLMDIWQTQRRLGVPADQRKLPQDNQSEAEWLADLEVIRKCMERTE